ncbi:response regulator [Sphingobacterium sp. DN00404]|uniref:Response regulator n=1 Tax=Sphingobacterium micropteri TaxID=2763501 RepID=A0ABR7YT19_9SPHI|nr:response regulator [Sphingobacterium micropteri]MBD1434376.1 response regulator [Sphingobacterium micropteri]
MMMKKKEKYNILIVDDELESVGHIETTLDQIPYIEVKKESNLAKARSMVDNGGVDILFLDLMMPVADGFTFLGLLKDVPATVMCSGNEIPGTAAFDNEVADCINKLASKKRVQRAVDKAIKKFHEHEAEREHAKAVITLRRVRDNKRVEINWQMIEYVSITDDILTIHDMDEKKEDYYCRLSTFLEKVPSHKFLRIHRKVAVKISAIRSKRWKTLTLTSWAKLTIGGNYEKDVKKIVEQLEC